MNPLRRCFECNRWYWAGLPRLNFMTRNEPDGGKSLWFGWTWKPEWNEFCSFECHEKECTRVFGPPLS